MVVSTRPSPAALTNSTEPVCVCPLFSETLPSRRAGLPWSTRQNDPRMIEAKLRLGEEAGFTPIVKMELGCLDFLEPRQEILENTGEKQVVRLSYDTPGRPLEGVITRMPNGSHADKKMIETIDDTMRMVWAWEHLGDRAAFRAAMRKVVQQVGDRGIVCFNVGHPFGSHDDHVTTIFFAFEHAAQMREAADRTCAVRKELIDIAADEGVRCFFAGSLGANMYSPDMVDQWMVPYCIELREHSHARGGVYYLHECGNMMHKVDRGVYERIMPDWLEGFEAPPLGDIYDLAALRRRLPREIVFKGNLNLEYLARATPADVETRTLELLESMRGYRHIVGGACSLLADTPLENLNALRRATDRFCGRA